MRHQHNKDVVGLKTENHGKLTDTRPKAPADTFRRLIYHRIAGLRDKYCGSCWCSSATMAGPCPCKCRADRGRRARFRRTSNNELGHLWWVALKTDRPSKLWWTRFMNWLIELRLMEEIMSITSFSRARLFRWRIPKDYASFLNLSYEASIPESARKLPHRSSSPSPSIGYPDSLEKRLTFFDHFLILFVSGDDFCCSFLIVKRI